MVRFDIEERISLKAGRSAMVPILKEELPLGMFSMFAGTQSYRGAMFVAQIANESATPLIPGPVALYRDGDFIGDGAMPRIEVGQSKELQYGTDLALQLEVAEPTTTKSIGSVKLTDKGVLLTSTVTQKTNFKVTNEDSTPRNILLLAPIDWKDVAPQPAERRKNVGFYKFECPASESLAQEVVQTKTENEIISLSSLSQDEFKEWTKAGVEVEDDLSQLMNRIFEAQSDVTKIRSERSLASGKISSVQQEQKRITDIIKVLDPQSSAIEGYLERLSQTEEKLAVEKQKAEDIDQQLRNAEAALRQLFERKRFASSTAARNVTGNCMYLFKPFVVPP